MLGIEFLITAETTEELSGCRTCNYVDPRHPAEISICRKIYSSTIYTILQGVKLVSIFLFISLEDKKGKKREIAVLFDPRIL